MVARYFRRRTPNALLIGGGPHASSDNPEVLTQGLVDLCVLGEGERSFQRLLEKKAAKEDLYQTPGISFLRDGNVVETTPAPFVENLDDLPLPAWHLLDFKQYQSFSGMADFFHWSATMFTSRGCPYKCIYCHKYFGRTFRARSPENVLSEVDLLRNTYGIRSIEFVDDIFNRDRARAAAILEGIRDRFPDVGIAFPNGLRADLLDEDLIRLLKEARCWHVSVAVETASPRMQKEIRKNVNLEKLKRNIVLLKKYGLYTRGFVMIGFPGETREEVMASVRFCLEQPLNYSLIFIVAPFNKTELIDRIDPKKLEEAISDTDHMDYRMGDYALGEIPYEELEKIRARYYRKGMLRWRNRKLWMSAVHGLVRGGLVKKIFLLVAAFSGVKKESVNRAGIRIRQKEFELLKEHLNIY